MAALTWRQVRRWQQPAVAANGEAVEEAEAGDAVATKPLGRGIPIAAAAGLQQHPGETEAEALEAAAHAIVDTAEEVAARR